MTRRHPAAERGFSLIVSLVLLVLITLVALASMRAVAMQSRMSASAYDRNLAFQAAETALREAEQIAVGALPGTFPASGCTGIYCATPAAGDTARWADASFTNWTKTTSTVSANAVAPQAIVEYMGSGANWFGCMQEIPRPPNCTTPRYRVTARSAANGRATVILQSDDASQ